MEKLFILLKELFSFDSIFTCFISTVGYGLGYYIPHALGAGEVISIVLCFAIGILFDKLAEKILASDLFKDDKSRKWKLGVTVYLCYLIAWYLIYYLVGKDLDEDLVLTIFIMFLITIGGFLFNVLKTFFVNLVKSKTNKDSNKTQQNS